MVRYTSSAALFLLSLYSPLQVSAQSLASAVSSRPELSTFLTVVSSFPDLVESVSSSGGTILAPSNNAFSSFLEAANLGPEGLAAVPESTVRSLLTYHVLPETLRSTDLVVRGGAVAETALSDNEEFANLDGDPNVVFASAFGSAGLDEGNVGTLRIYSGAGNPANVSSADIEFDNGVIHVIESVLNLPQTPSKTAEAAALSVLISALESTNLTSTVDSTPKLTILAPTDDAFAALGIDLSSLSTDELAEILKYHVIVGAVGYSTVLEDGEEYETLSGETVTVRKQDGQVWVNDVAVAQANVILSNGVAHVLSGVLVPPTDGSPNGSSSTSRPASSRTATASNSNPTGDADESEEEDSSAATVSMGAQVVVAVVTVLGFLAA